MQNQKTIQFWDDFYESEESEIKEWILEPNEYLLQHLAREIDKENSNMVLEIGCGTSTLSRELYKLMSSERQSICFVATDVSSIGIQQCQRRDKELLSQNLKYNVMNITEKNQSLKGKVDVVLDKGCLDTFLFRSKNTGRGYGSLVRAVLDNVHHMLNPSGGKYLILSPRTKLKAIRDYVGFSSVVRRQLGPGFQPAGLQENHKKANESLFLYICQVNPDYNVDKCDDAFGLLREKPIDSDPCPKCKINFYKFRLGEALEGRGASYWYRLWKGHKQHCKG